MQPDPSQPSPASFLMPAQGVSLVVNFLLRFRVGLAEFRAGSECMGNGTKLEVVGSTVSGSSSTNCFA